jgi:NAD(P)-dependent dehydrogenase (short-subunit alcohol dehydrogenase family)
MSGRLDGKIVLMTGAGSGLGRESALLFAAEGAAVVVTDLIPERVDRVVGEVRTAGGQAAGAKADVRQAQDMVDAVALAVDTFGRLDVLMCSAGRCGWRTTPGTACPATCRPATRSGPGGSPPG